MSDKTHWRYKVWTLFLPVTFAVLLFPNIIDIHGFGMSLLYTGMGVGFIWFQYFLIGQLLHRAVTKELKRRELNPQVYKRCVDDSSELR